MKYSLIALFISLILSSCHKEETVLDVQIESSECVQNFMALNDLKVAPSGEKNCFYYSIYEFENSYYFRLTWCLCDFIDSYVGCNDEIEAIIGDDKYNVLKEKAILKNIILVKR